MTSTVFEQIGDLLTGTGTTGSFAARRTAAADTLRLEVKGVGPLRFPISASQARKLCQAARPARYGKGEQTLLDRTVRDTWEIPKSRVKIDQRRWKQTLLPMLDALGADLGLRADQHLKAELHSMLIYGPGQFFRRHQDSEKADAMVGTLVVTLPSPFKGGSFVIEHRDAKVTYRATKQPLTFIAFYADCHHEVRPVTEGYRIVLTYNLMLEGEGEVAAAPRAPQETVAALAECLREYFGSPLPPRYSWEADDPPRDPPDRLVFLLDHEYTASGLGWHLLKGEDAARVALLRAAAERAGCEVVLALAEIQESWSCYEDDRGSSRGRSWWRDEDDEWEEDEPQVDGPDAYELDELIESSLRLSHWLDASGKKAEPVVTSVDSEEVCCVTPSSDLEPYAAEYEGYMGNYGNTMDRWYRRAALVLWPRARDFAIRSEASPAWALETLEQRVQAGEVVAAQEMARSLLSFWSGVARLEERAGFFDQTLRVAAGLDEPALAADLLHPFQLVALTPEEAPALVALVRRYGESWLSPVVAGWSAVQRWESALGKKGRAEWLAALPRLCRALIKADAKVGTRVARGLLADRWQELQAGFEAQRRLAGQSLRDKGLASLAEPLLGFLESAAVLAETKQLERAAKVLCDTSNNVLLPCLVRMLRLAAKSLAPAAQVGMGLEAIRQHCIRVLETRLEQPPRAEDDWAITPPWDCSCELCARLGEFLTDARASSYEWKLAKPGRQHVHSQLDRYELPVLHETRRTGSPFTLVLTKTPALFEREAAQRRSWQADLQWLTKRAKADGGEPGGKARLPRARRT